MGRWNSKSKYDGKWVVGEKIGKWTVVDGTVCIVKGYAKILCQCDCGNQPNLIDAFTLSAGTSTQCTKCGFSRKTKNNPSWKGYEEIPAALFTRMKSNAIKRKIVFSLTMEDLWNKFLNQNKICTISKLPISFENRTASLDRIDSTKGYIKENVQWVHKAVNVMKNGYSQDYFIAMCHKIAEQTQCPNVDLTNRDTFIFGRTKND